MFGYLAPALLFSSDQKSLNLEDKLYLEDVANAAEWTQTNSKVEHLSLSLSFDHPDSKAFYGKAAKRLKEALPRLKSIDFNGGYLFDPQQDVRLYLSTIKQLNKTKLFRTWKCSKKKSMT